MSILLPTRSPVWQNSYKAESTRDDLYISLLSDISNVHVHPYQVGDCAELLAMQLCQADVSIVSAVTLGHIVCSCFWFYVLVHVEVVRR